MRLPPRIARWALVIAAITLAVPALRMMRDHKSPGTGKPDPGEHDQISGDLPDGKEMAGAAVPAPAVPPVTVMPVAVELSTALNREDESPEQNLQAVEQILYMFRQGFGENPVGQNEDVVAALLGDNSKHAAYLPKDCPAIKNGKLVDRWGTPWWFHPVSGRHMEIRSAGPDRNLFTSDDIVQP